jgi:hypothetical protein
MPTERDPAPEATVLGLKRVLLHPEKPPVVASRFFFTAIGDELQLDVGFTDLAATRNAVEGAKAGKEGEVELYIYERLALSTEAVLDLFETSKKMIAHLRKTGRMPNETKQPTN